VGVGGITVSVGAGVVAAGTISVKVAVASGKGASVGGDCGGDVGVDKGLLLHAMASKISSNSKEKRLTMRSTPCNF
jgi:hypothetical protein